MPQLRLSLKMKMIQCSLKDIQNILINIELYKINSFWRYFVLRNHSGTSLLLAKHYRKSEPHQIYLQGEIHVHISRAKLISER